MANSKEETGKSIWDRASELRDRAMRASAQVVNDIIGAVGASHPVIKGLQELVSIVYSMGILIEKLSKQTEEEVGQAQTTALRKEKELQKELDEAYDELEETQTELDAQWDVIETLRAKEAPEEAPKIPTADVFSTGIDGVVERLLMEQVIERLNDPKHGFSCVILGLENAAAAERLVDKGFGYCRDRGLQFYVTSTGIVAYEEYHKLEPVSFDGNGPTS